jgi:hypothetical protein
MTVPSSSFVIDPSPSLSKIRNASFNSKKQVLMFEKEKKREKENENEKRENDEKLFDKFHKTDRKVIQFTN